MKVLEAIHQITADKERNRIYPYCALLSEISALCGLSEESIRNELKSLKSQGKIEFKQTINSWSIYLKDKSYGKIKY